MMISTYNYLAQTSYYNNRPARKTNSSHDAKELKSIYNNIVKMNRESPLYMFDLSPDNQNFAVNVKESAYSLMDVLEQFSQDSEIFDKTNFTSSDTDSVAITVEDKFGAASMEDFFIRVDTLATNQINEGRHVYPESSGLTPGRYNFNISIFENKYSFDFPVSPGSNNQDIQIQLSDFINSAKIGLKASVIYDETENKSYMYISSNFTGTSSDEAPSFSMEDTSFVNGRGIAEYFDLNNVVQNPANAHFNIDGTDKVLRSNTFTYNNAMTISLLSPTTEPVWITKSTDADTLVNSLNQLTDSYNSLVDTANNNRATGNESNKLLSSINLSSSKFRNSLEACGISFDSSGKMKLDDSLVYQAADDGDLEDLLTDTSGVISSLRKKANIISLNPMEFIEKKIVTYPNISKPATTNPYITSIYSGMLFNYYC